MPKQSEEVKPDYTPDFLDQVAKEYEQRNYGEATVHVVDDWTTMIYPTFNFEAF